MLPFIYKMKQNVAIVGWTGSSFDGLIYIQLTIVKNEYALSRFCAS